MRQDSKVLPCKCCPSSESNNSAFGRNAACADAWINWGRLVYELGDLKQSESIYRRGIEQCERDEWLHYNLAITLEDQLRTNEAIDTYLMAIACDSDFADAHFNVARLYHAKGNPQRAIRHLACYRKLTT